ncbi:hypothetical protein DSM104299_02014 [Baekduia alba]|uniref:hypothetical protein n=1 Tax=Baekduia alba TaxID=2997333 RepID=UPI002342217F|nr:hypothetical protein [Baekduia alba]WCB93302.1 hypothetical protein DSM104299_02014 [Baekduia alba]
MTLVTSPPQTIPPPIAAPRSSSALVIADECSCERALALLGEALDITSARVMIATMPMPLPAMVSAFAPLSGMTTYERLIEESLERADEAARVAALGLPAACVSYCTLRRWSQVADLLEAAWHDVVVLGCVPRRRPLRRIVEVSGAAQTALVFARPAVACR